MEAKLQSPFGQTILEPGVVTIGSAPDSRLIVHDAKVSPHHAVLRPTEQGYTISDLWSTEGTFVNDQRLEPFVTRLLASGDRISIGETVFTYVLHEGAMPTAGQGSRPEVEPAALVVPSELSAYGADAQLSSASPNQTLNGSATQQEYASAPPQQPNVPMGTKVEPKQLTGEVVRHSKPVIPAKVKTWYVLACIAVLFQAVLNTLGGVFILSQAQNSTQQFIGSFTLVWGIVMSVLGVFVVRKSRWALIAAVVVYILTLLLALVSSPIGAIIQAALFLTPMIVGMNALSKMKTLEAAHHAVPSG